MQYSLPSDFKFSEQILFQLVLVSHQGISYPLKFGTPGSLEILSPLQWTVHPYWFQDISHPTIFNQFST